MRLHMRWPLSVRHTPESCRACFPIGNFLSRASSSFRLRHERMIRGRSGMTQKDAQQKAARGPLLIGATGHVGRMLLASGSLQGAVAQSRQPLPGHITWDPLGEDVPKDLPAVSGVIMMAGTATGGADHRLLALAAARAGAALGVPVLIASSQAVYGPTPGPHMEDGPCAPAGAYGMAKFEMEAAVADQPHVTCLRIGNVAGADMLFRSMAGGAVRLDELPDGGGPRRAMIGPVTLARCLIDLLALDHRPALLNLAQPGLIDMADLVRAAGADWTFQPAPDTVLPRLELDLSRLTAMLSVPPADATTLVAEARACGWSPA